MRKRTCVALVGLLVTATGCKLTLPAGIGALGPVTPAGSGKPTVDQDGGASCADRFAKYDKNKDKVLSLDEYLKKGGEKGASAEEAETFLDLDADGDRKLSAEEYAAGCDDAGTTPKKTPKPPMTAPPSPPPGAGCEENFAKYDRDGDGAWHLDEFMGWDRTRPRPKTPCDGGAVISNQGGGIVAAGGGNIIAAGGGALLPKRALNQVDPNGGFISDNGGGLISNNGGMLISNNAGSLIVANNAMPFPCPPDDPEFRFNQFDHDGDGRITAGEFCDGPLKRPTPGPIYTGGPEPYPYPTPGYTPGPSSCEDGFFRTDTNYDGLVSPEEFKTQYYTPDMVYANNGGKAEWVQAAPVDPYAIFKMQDRDGDGYLSLEESCGLMPSAPPETPPPADWCGFYKIDGDNNGEATWEEFANWSLRNEFPAPSKDVIYTRFAGYDFDQNWIITQDEYCGYAVGPEPYPYATPTPMPTGWYTPPPPSATPPWNGPTPTPNPNWTPGANTPCYDAWRKAGGGKDVPYDAFAKARIDQVRWFKAPTEEEIRRMHDQYVREAKEYDWNGDGLIQEHEATALCSDTDGGGLISNNAAGYRTK